MNRYLLLLALLGLLGFVFRRRLALAFKVGVGLYVGLAAIRLFQAGDSDLPVLEVAAGVALFGLVWLVLWLVVRARERRGLR